MAGISEEETDNDNSSAATGRSGVKRPRNAGNSGKERRARTIFNIAQLQALERIFVDVQYPDADMKTKIARRLDVEEGTIQIWFQNRRAKFKRLRKGDTQGVATSQAPPVTASAFPHQPQHGYCPTRMGCDTFRSTQPPVQCDVQGQVDHASQFHHHMQSWNVPMSTFGESTYHLKDSNGQLSSVKLIPFSNDSPTSAVQDSIAAFCESGMNTEQYETTLIQENNSSNCLARAGLPQKTPNWPVKEPLSSASAFGRLDSSKVPRVCIQHENRHAKDGHTKSSNQMFDGRNNFISTNALSTYRRQIAREIRNKLLRKRDPPRPPPPNQSCAVLPKSERNELAAALMRHRLGVEGKGSSTKETDQRLGHNRFGEYRTYNWSSSSEESSDSEGLAPPRRRRKIVQKKTAPPPNKVCTSVPLTDRTLPFPLHSRNKDVREAVPPNRAVESPAQEPPQPDSDDESLWDSDDSAWAYYDRGPTKRTGQENDHKVSLSERDSSTVNTGDAVRSHVEQILLSEPNKTSTSEGRQVCQNGMVSKGTEGHVTSNRLSNGDENQDDLAEISLAKELAEMLPSPFGCLLNSSTNLLAKTDETNKNHKRARAQSDPTVSSREDNCRNQVSEIIAASQLVRETSSPSSSWSADSCLSALSSLFTFPVSPNSLARELPDGAIAIDEKVPTEMVNKGCVPEAVGSLSANEHQAASGVMHAADNSRNLPIQLTDHNVSVQQNTWEPFDTGVTSCNARSVIDFPVTSSSVPTTCENTFFQKSITMHNGPNPGVIRPIPTHASSYGTSQMAFQQSGTPLSSTSCSPNSSIHQLHAPLVNLRHVPDEHFDFNQQMRNHIPTPTRNPGSHQTAVQAVERCPVQTGNTFPVQPVDSALHGQACPQTRSPFTVSHQPLKFCPVASSQIDDSNGTVLPGTTGNFVASQPRAPSEPQLPPNQVCTAVPDAVSSEGLMARYMAWNRARALPN